MEQAEIVELKSTMEAMKMELAQLKESFFSLLFLRFKPK